MLTQKSSLYPEIHEINMASGRKQLEIAQLVKKGAHRFTNSEMYAPILYNYLQLMRKSNQESLSKAKNISRKT